MDGGMEYVGLDGSIVKQGLPPELIYNVMECVGVSELKAFAESSRLMKGLRECVMGERLMNKYKSFHSHIGLEAWKEEFIVRLSSHESVDRLVRWAEDGMRGGKCPGLPSRGVYVSFPSSKNNNKREAFHYMSRLRVVLPMLSESLRTLVVDISGEDQQRSVGNLVAIIRLARLLPCLTALYVYTEGLWLPGCEPRVLKETVCCKEKSELLLRTLSIERRGNKKMETRGSNSEMEMGTRSNTVHIVAFFLQCRENFTDRLKNLVIQFSGATHRHDEHEAKSTLLDGASFPNLRTLTIQQPTGGVLSSLFRNSPLRSLTLSFGLETGDQNLVQRLEQLLGALSHFSPTLECLWLDVDPFLYMVGMEQTKLGGFTPPIKDGVMFPKLATLGLRSSNAVLWDGFLPKVAVKFPRLANISFLSDACRLTWKTFHPFTTNMFARLAVWAELPGINSVTILLENGGRKHFTRPQLLSATVYHHDGDYGDDNDDDDGNEDGETVSKYFQMDQAVDGSVNDGSG